MTNTKYLGVTIHNDGKFNLHVSNTTNVGNKMLGFVKRNLRVNSKSAKEKAYKMLVRPKNEYTASMWDPHTKVQISSRKDPEKGRQSRVQ